ncbi:MULTISPECIES: FUSC family protein [unclassified Achromobacter]|uniref:FUSC family protein n=1 Tax=unclassified Achromobacter TaxID=2626865 RepID=UPI000B72F356|nr:MULTISPECIES: FUSC family protein [unclassified Achromobacter]OWT79656.1 fusaric acid resistance protein [Achromobacter sp. HZ28]
MASPTSTSPPAPRRLLALPSFIDGPALGFAIRTTVASLLAFYLALQMQMDNPKWAAMTVWIVAQGSRGMSLSKGRYRAIGTLAGAAVALALVGTMAQAPWLFLACLAVWLGLCTALATGLRNFSSYGAVLAGYTAVIIAMDSVGQPGEVFDIAVARVCYILLGVIVEGVLAAVWEPDRGLADIRRRLDDYLRKAAELTRRMMSGEAPGHAPQRLFVAGLDMDTAVQFAAAGSLEVRRRMGHVRAATVATMAQLVAAHALAEDRRADGQAGAPPELLQLVGDIAAQPAGRAAAAREQARLAVAVQAQRMADWDGGADWRGRLADAKRLALLRALETATQAREAVWQAHPARTRERYATHLDSAAAVRNGIRAALAMMLAAGFWIGTAWPSGPGFVTITGVVCALFSTRPNPVAGGIGFLQGTALAAVVAILWVLLVMPLAHDYASFALPLALVLVGAGLAMRRPATAAIGASFSIFLWDLLSPGNGTYAYVPGQLNGAITLMVGIACGVVAFTLLFPTDRRAALARLHAAIRRDLAGLGQGAGQMLEPLRRAPSPARLHSKTADRIRQQMAQGIQVPPAQMARDLDGILGALAIGDAVIRLRHQGGEGSGHPTALTARERDTLLRRLRRQDFRGVARLATRLADRLARRVAMATPPARDSQEMAGTAETVMEKAAIKAANVRTAQLRTILLLREIAATIAMHHDFLAGTPFQAVA